MAIQDSLILDFKFPYALRNGAIGNESLLLVPVHAPLCKIENNSRARMIAKGGAMAAIVDLLMVEPAVLGYWKTMG